MNTDLETTETSTNNQPFEAGETPDKLIKYDEFELNGKKIQLLGVTHIPKTIDAYSKQIEELIRKAGVILIEAAPKAWGAYDPNNLEAMRQKDFHQTGKKVSIEVIIARMEKDPGFFFYKTIEQMVAKINKPMVTLDPNKIERLGIDERLAGVDQAVTVAKAVGGVKYPFYDDIIL